MTNTDYNRYERIKDEINVRMEYMRTIDAMHYMVVRLVPPWNSIDKKKLPQYMQFALGELYQHECDKLLKDIEYPVYHRGYLYYRYKYFPQSVRKYVMHTQFILRVPVFRWNVRTYEQQTSKYRLEQVKEYNNV